MCIYTCIIIKKYAFFNNCPKLKVIIDKNSKKYYEKKKKKIKTQKKKKLNH